MKHKVLLLLFVTFFAIWPPAESFGDPLVSKDLINSVLLLSSSKTTNCGTGFILSTGDVLTNLHVTASLCKDKTCSGLQLARARDIGASASEKIEVKSALLKTQIASLDLAILKIDSKEQLRGVFSLGTAPMTNGSVVTLGFPACQKLTRAEGAVTKLSEFHFETSAKGTYGVSGSPMLNEQGQLIGIVNESASFLEALESLGFGGLFELRASRIDRGAPFLTNDPDANLLQDADLLLARYKREVLPLEGMNRLREGLEFLGAVDDLKLSTLKRGAASDITARFNLCGEYLSNVASVSLDASGEKRKILHEIDLLCAAYSLEYKGPFVELLKPIEPSRFSEDLAALGRSTEEARELGSLAQDSLGSGYFGVEIYLIQQAAIWGLVVLLLSTLWSITAGYVYAATTGGRLERIAVTTIVSLLWPISVPFWFLWKARRK